MNDRDERRGKRLINVQTFNRSVLGQFAAESLARQLFGELDGVITDLDAAALGQVREPVSKETMLHALELDLDGLERTASSIELRTKQEGFAAPYRVPENAREGKLLRHTVAVLAHFEPAENDTPAITAAKAALVAQFIKFEMPADFVAHLRADHDAIVKRNEEHREDNQEGVASTTAIGVLLTRGNEIVSQLDTIMRNKFARNPEILRKWESASHLERAPQREKKPEQPQPPKAQA